MKRELISQLLSRPVAVTMCFLLVAGLGIVACNRIPSALLPEVPIPKLIVTFTNPGMPPEEFDRKLIETLRLDLLQLEGLIDLTTYTNSSKSEITLMFDYGVDMDLAYISANEKIDLVLALTSIKLTQPVIRKFQISQFPSMYLSLEWKGGKDSSFSELSSFAATFVKRKLEQQREISFVDISGGTKDYYVLDINDKVIKSLGITIEDIAATIRNSNVSYGNINVAKQQFVYSLSFENAALDPQHIGKIKIKVGDRVIPLSSMSTVGLHQVSNSTYFHNLHKSLSLSIVKNPEVQSGEFVAKVDETLKELQHTYPSIQLAKTSDQTLILRATINQLFQSLLIGALLAILATFLFLRSLVTAVIICVTMAVSLLIDLLLCYLLGVTINLVSLSGLMLGVGLMIDNIIISVDSIEQRAHQFGNVRLGAIEGTCDIIVAMLSSSLTTCAIFVPLVFLSGLTGLLFYDQALVVSLAMASSFITSIALVPTLYLLLNPRVRKGDTETRIASIYHYLFKVVSSGRITLIVVVTTILLLGVWSFVRMPKERLPEMTSQDLNFVVEWNRNSGSYELNELSRQLVSPIYDKLVISEIYTGQQDFILKSQRNETEADESYFSLLVKDGVSKSVIKNTIVGILSQIDAAATIKFMPAENILNYVLIPAEFNLKILSYEEDVTSGNIKQSINSRFGRVLSHLTEEAKSLALSIREDKVMIYGLDRDALINHLKLKFGYDGVSIGSHGAGTILFTNVAPDMDDVLKSTFITGDGLEYILGDFIEVEIVNRKKAIEADTDGRADVLEVDAPSVNEVIEYVKKSYPGSAIKFKGDYLSAEKLYDDTKYILVIGTVLLFLILSIQFESLTTPLIILTEIPIVIAFSLTVLYLVGISLNVMSFIGLLVTCGITINDSILKLDLIVKLRNSGMSIREATATAGERRMSAIVMTSLTTIVSVIPTLFQSDISSQIQIPEMIPIIAGLTLGTFASVFLIPILYIRLSK